MLRPALALLLLAASAPAQTAMELNRSGRWAQAAEIAAARAADTSAPLGERCQAYLSLTYASVRLGRAEAREHLAAFDALCSASESGQQRQADDLRAEIGAAAVPVVSATDDDWRVAADPAALGLDPAALDAHAALCDRSAADACLVVYDGQIVQEWYGPRYREPIGAMSSTKSVTGLLVGMLIADGALALDDPAGRYVPEWTAGAEAGVTVRHLLTMTSGLLTSHTARPPDSHVGGVSDKDSLVFSLPLVAAPGTAWAYSNEGSYLLSPLLRRAAGEPIQAYAARELFAPLGMTRTHLLAIREDQAWTHADLQTTPRDLARIGQLMLQGGRWDGEPVVPADWVEASVRPSQDLNPAYGLGWWIGDGFYYASGYLDTNVYVVPDDALVVVRMQRLPVPDAEPYGPAAPSLFRQFVAD